MKITVSLLKSICLFLVAGFVLATPYTAEAETSVLQALRQGGYNLYFRHEMTNWQQQDNITQLQDLKSCDGNRVRQLSSAGKDRAAKTGEWIRKLGIPVSEVLASPYCRSMETARAFSLGEVQATDAVINLRSAHYFGGRDAVIKTAQALLAQNPPAGGNRIIAAHGNVAQAATPVYPGEGEAVIFKPDGKGGFDFFTRIAPDQWQQLLTAQ